MMGGTMDGTCRICGRFEPVRCLDIYTIGSEGTDACHDCEMAVVEFIRQMMRTASKARMEGYKAAKTVAEAKAKAPAQSPRKNPDCEPVQGEIAK